MAVRILRVWESYQVHSYVTNYTFVVHHISDCASKFLDVHLWQACCWEEATAVHVLSSLYTVESPHQRALTGWLDEE